MTKTIFLSIFALTMDNNSLEEQQTVSAPISPASPKPEYPSRSKGGKTVGLVIFLISLVVVGGAVFYFASLKENKEKEVKSTPEPFVVQETKEEGVVEATPSGTPKEEVVDKKSVSISVLNGTGITGEAAYLQDKLEALGYTDIKVGNAPKQDYVETVVKFSSSLSKSVVDEIVAELKKIYKEVKTQTGVAGSYDIEITTGLRTGQTPKATVTPTPKPSASPSPTKTPSPSPTSSL